MENTPLSHTALRDVSLTITEESFTAIAGETGSAALSGRHPEISLLMEYRSGQSKKTSI